MATPFKAGDRVVHMVPPALGAAPLPDVQIMGAAEGLNAFVLRVNEMAGLAAAMRASQDATAFTAMLTRVNAIDD